MHLGLEIDILKLKNISQSGLVSILWRQRQTTSLFVPSY